MLRNKIGIYRDRHGKGISKAHLARAVGVSRSYVTKLENGQSQPSAEVMFRVAQYFGCRVEDVFQYTPGSVSS